jgi:hypothetical protein
MTSSNLIRLSGLAAVMAATLLLITEIVGYTQGGDPFKGTASATHAFESTLRMIAFVVLLPLGLVGLYGRQSEAAGPLGLLGFLAAFSGTVLVAGFLWTDTFVAPELARSAPQLLAEGPPPGRSLSLLVFGVGWALFGLVSLWAGVYPRQAAMLLIVGAVIGTVLNLTFLLVPFGGLLFEAAVAWLGVALFTGWGTSVSEQPSRVS